MPGCMVALRRRQLPSPPVPTSLRLAFASRCATEEQAMLSDTIERPQVANTVVASHFPTLFMMREYAHSAALNQKLEGLMLRLETETANIAPATSNIGGYHSDTTLFQRTEPEIVA